MRITAIKEVHVTLFWKLKSGADLLWEVANHHSNACKSYWHHWFKKYTGELIWDLKKKSSFSNCCFVFNLYQTIALRNISKSEWGLSGCKSLCSGPGRWESLYLTLVIKERIQASADNSDSTLKLPDNWRKSGELLNVKKKKN